MPMLAVLLLAAPFVPYSIRLPRAATAIALGPIFNESGTFVVAGDAAGAVEEVGWRGKLVGLFRVGGAVTALRVVDSSPRHPRFVFVAYRTTDGSRAELWSLPPDGPAAFGSVVASFAGEGSVLVSVGSMRDRVLIGTTDQKEVRVVSLDGEPTATVRLPEPPAALAYGDGVAKGPALVVAARPDGSVAAFGLDSQVVWSRKVARRGGLRDLQRNENGELAYASTGEAGMLDLRRGTPVGEPFLMPFVVQRVRALWSGRPLVAGAYGVKAPRHIDGWTFDSPIVVIDAVGWIAAVALADGTLTVRTPLLQWMRHGDAPEPRKP